VLRGDLGRVSARSSNNRFGGIDISHRNKQHNSGVVNQLIDAAKLH
jgi:hypothetical protein